MRGSMDIRMVRIACSWVFHKPCWICGKIEVNAIQVMFETSISKHQLHWRGWFRNIQRNCWFLWTLKTSYKKRIRWSCLKTHGNQTSCGAKKNTKGFGRHGKLTANWRRIDCLYTTLRYRETANPCVKWEIVYHKYSTDEEPRDEYCHKGPDFCYHKSYLRKSDRRKPLGTMWWIHPECKRECEQYLATRVEWRRRNC